MTDAKITDFSAPPETIKIEKLPGVFRVEPNRPELNLGEINIVTTLQVVR